MDSLTTSYLVCMLIGSMCAVGGAVAGSKVFPFESSAIATPPVVESPVSAAPSQNTAQTQPAVSSAAQ